MFRRIPLTIIYPANKIEQNRTKFPLSEVRPSSSNEIDWNPERNRTKSNYIEQNRMLMGSIFRQTKKVIFSCLEIENLSGGEETGNYPPPPPKKKKNIRTG